MNDINQRICKIALEFFNDNNSKFAKFLGTSEANIRNYKNKTEPKINVINKISNGLEICYEWLITGQGEMLRSNNSSPAPMVPPPLNDATHKIYEGIIEKKDAIIRDKDAEISRLNREIGALQAENEMFKKINPTL